MPIIAALHRYPVKSLRGHSVASLALAPWGAEEDRRWLVTDPDGRFLTQRDLPAMARIAAHPDDTGLRLVAPDRPEHRVSLPDPSAEPVRVTVWRDDVFAQDAGEETARWLSDTLNTPARLVRMSHPARDRVRTDDGLTFPVSFADAFPFLVTTTASLDDLNTRLPAPIGMTRFRPNIVISGTAPWDEDTWREVRIGPVTLHLARACTRCKITTIDADTGHIPDPREPLATLARFRRTPGGVIFGRNALLAPETPSATIRVGDPVHVVREEPT